LSTKPIPMENEIVDQVQPIESKRPTFLTVLCIITFAVSAYYVFDGFLTIFVSKSFDPSQWEAISEQVEEAMQGADPGAAQVMETIMQAVSETTTRAINHATSLGIVTLIVALLSAYGAFLMFNLRKIGFTIYTAAKIVGIVVPMVLLGFNLLTIIIYSFAAVVGLIFIILYAVNRKHMA
jgi:hypothetical protein